MDGGNGADTYYVDNPGDVVVDTGTDKAADLVFINSYISSTFKYTLGAGIENATLTDDAKDADLAGNLSDNTLTGNIFDNALEGGSGRDSLSGGTGNDSLIGGADNDSLTGGMGRDSLFGGSGADDFIFSAINDTSLTSTTDDVIADFSQAQGDQIDLSAIDANPAKSGDQAFSFMGSAFSGNATGQLYFNTKNHTVYGSTDADTQPEFAIQLSGVSSVSAQDFIL